MTEFVDGVDHYSKLQPLLIEGSTGGGGGGSPLSTARSNRSKLNNMQGRLSPTSFISDDFVSHLS